MTTSTITRDEHLASLGSGLVRELKFALRERALLLWVVLVLGLSTTAVSFGLIEVKQQHATIEKLLEADQQDRLAVAKKLKDWGSAAYYNFHFTHSAPSRFAFAALGQRDTQPWKHRIRMLALEGQIYERDSGNPVIALTGRFDFAFLAAFILPLVIIALVYDLKTQEQTAGRLHLLEATAGPALWRLRTFARIGLIFCALILPLTIAAGLAGTPLKTLVLALLSICIYTAFWAILCYKISAWRKSSGFILMSLMGIWLILAVVVPTSARLIIDELNPVPSGAEILMTQREAVNDAWDLPRQTTFKPFFERHPEWAHYQAIDQGFEWQWYYAFQQVGDQKTELLTQAYIGGRAQREQAARLAALIAPPALLTRQLQRLANTDMAASIRYEEDVRRYHGALRAYYYPKFFDHLPFDQSQLTQLPTFPVADPEL